MLKPIGGAKIVAIAAILVAFLLFVGGGITGYFSYTRALEDQLSAAEDEVRAAEGDLNRCVSHLSDVNDSLSECSSALSQANSNLDACNARRAATEEQLAAAEGNLTECRVSEEQLGAQLEISIASYEELAVNSVRSVCCTFSDAQGGTAKQWSIVNNSIVCSGNRTVNCTSGEVE